MKTILFVTGTRADYGKIKILMKEVQQDENFQLKIFVTGMHMLSRYGATHLELEKDGFADLYKYINQTKNTQMDLVLSNTILGLSNYINEYQVDLIVVHGDRVESLAGAIVGALNNIRVAHVEGGEVSGTIDESIRHAISKFSHLHFVANEGARRRLLQLGENGKHIFVIGSPDIDIMLSHDLPDLSHARERYDISFERYGILMYHPVTTELHEISVHAHEVVQALLQSHLNYIVIYPNNDSGSSFILEELQSLQGNGHFRIFPSIKFEYFLTLLKHADFMIGNSSAGIREAGIYGIPSVDIGNRQKGRYDQSKEGIFHVKEDRDAILEAIGQATHCRMTGDQEYGDGHSGSRFMEILNSPAIWSCEIQKRFIDVE